MEFISRLSIRIAQSGLIGHLERTAIVDTWHRLMSPKPTPEPAPHLSSEAMTVREIRRKSGKKFHIWLATTRSCQQVFEKLQSHFASRETRRSSLVLIG